MVFLGGGVLSLGHSSMHGSIRVRIYAMFTRSDLKSIFSSIKHFL